MSNSKKYKYFGLNSTEFNEFHEIYMNSPDFSIRQRVQIILLWTKGYRLSSISNILHYQPENDYVLIYYKAYRYGGIEWLLNDDIDFLRTEINKLEASKEFVLPNLFNILIKIIGWIFFVLSTPILLPFYLISLLFTIRIGINPSRKDLNITLPNLTWIPKVIETILFPIAILAVVILAPIFLIAYWLDRLSVNFESANQTVSKNIKIEVSDSSNVNINTSESETKAAIEEILSLVRKLSSYFSNINELINFLDKNKGIEKKTDKKVFDFFFKIDDFNRKTVNWRVITIIVAIFLATYILLQSKFITLIGTWVILGLLITFTNRGCEVKKFNPENLEEQKGELIKEIAKDTFVSDEIQLVENPDNTFSPDSKCRFRSIMGSKQDSIIRVDTLNHKKQDYFVSGYNDRYYLYVIAYSDLRKAALQRRYFVQNGFYDSKIIPTKSQNGYEYHVSIFDFDEHELAKAGKWQKVWDEQCKDETAKSRMLNHK